MLLKHLLVEIKPPKKIFDEIKETQKRIAKKYNTFHEIGSPLGPRITITLQENVDSKYLKKIEKTIKILSNKIKPFKVKIDGTGSFRKNRVIYLKVVKSRKLNDLYKTMSKELGKFGKVLRFGAYIPHISLARKDIGEEELKKAIKEFRKENISYTFNADKLHIAKSGSRQRARIYKSFKLKA